MGLIRKALEIIDKKTNIGLAFSKKTESETNLVSETKPSLLKRVQKIQSDFFQSDSIPDGIFHETEEDTLVDLDVLDVAVQEEEEENEERNLETAENTPSEEELPSIEIENFAGNLEKIDIGEGEAELLEEELEPQEVIDLDEEASITKADELKEWEEAAKQDIDDELEKTLLKEISKQNEFQDTLEQIQTQVSETEKEIQASKDNKAAEELELLQKKLENYLVLLEITKDLVKSSDFEEFFENLLYSIEGQLGPESIVIFSKRNADSEYFQAYAFDGVEIEPELKLHKSEPACQIFQNLDYPKFAREIPSEGLPEKDWSILNNPFTEVITPMKTENGFLGFIVTGKLLSGENYTEEDFEFLKQISELAGSFIPKIWDITEIKTEVEHLQTSVRSYESISTLVETLYDCNSFDTLFDELNERLQRDFRVSKLSLLILTQEEDYIIFNSNYFSIDTISKFILKKDSKLIPLISQVTGMYKIENFENFSELTSQIPKEELENMKEFSAFPLLHLGRLFGILVIHEMEQEEWTAELKQTLIQVSNLISPIVANITLQTKTEIFSKNPFDPVQDAVERELEKAKESNQKFTLVVLKVLSVTRIINLLGLEFFRHYMSFLTSKLQNHVEGEDWISRVGEGKFAIFLKGKDKFQAEEFFSVLKQELVKFPNPPRDFKLSIQLYSLTFPDQAQNKRKFIELIEDT